MNASRNQAAVQDRQCRNPVEAGAATVSRKQAPRKGPGSSHVGEATKTGGAYGSQSSSSRTSPDTATASGMSTARPRLGSDSQGRLPFWALRGRQPRQIRLPLHALVVFTRQMAMLLHAGSGVVPGVAAIRRQVRKPKQAAVLDRLIDDVEGGRSLTEALRRQPETFDPVYCAVVAAGEAGGTLTEMFDRLAGIVGRRRGLRNKLVGALAYPALLVCMSSAIMCSLFFFVIPRFESMFQQLAIEPPASTRLMLSLAGVLAGWWPLFVVLAIAIGAAAVATLVSQKGRQWLSNVQVNLPLLGRLFVRLIQGQVFRTIGMLLDSGVGVLESLELARRSTRNRRFQRLFDDLAEAVASGGRLSTAFERSGLVEPYVCQAIHTGEDTGGLGTAMTYCADILDETNTELINTLMKLLEPIILIGMGLVVGVVAVSLFLPLFDLTAALR